MFITSRASTFFAIRSTPARALRIFFFPSHLNGIVTIPTVSMSIDLAMRATSGPAPVPVPPPIPAVMNTIFVPSLSMLRISSSLSSAFCFPVSGLFPAPSPSSPSCRCTGTGESSSAFLSVLHSTNVTSCMPSLYMWFTALPPPPPTPMTFIMLLGFSGSPKACAILPNFLSSAIIILSF